MKTFEELIASKEVKAEYKKAFLLNMFQKLCVRMNCDETFKRKIRNLYLQSYDKNETTKLIIENEFSYNLDVSECELFNSWMQANLQKHDRRKPLSLELKKQLFSKQHGVCAVCGESLGDDWSKIHIDHIVPFKLVGDELPNNYQDLCETCNECKSVKTDFIFKELLKLN